ncbi:ParB/RepB/Spo0J family partition protein [Saccharomonospora saliphila]|uniref:ParB/RepB/Spo0J family partition protein n=1 Tax=Saccharomonospora saliphila TaxID=369829 RepID=UPI00036FAFE7|nr:hypothetical protein [Saccharomonospora saliphila]
MPSPNEHTPTLVHVDPRTLILEDNSRTLTDIEVDRPDLVASVRHHGVRTPVAADRDEDGNLRVRFGFSRVLAAVRAVDTHPTIPVIVHADTDDDASRLIDQIVENNLRAGYSEADQARNLERLTLFGLTADQIAQHLSTDVDTVQAGLRVRRSPAASQALETHHQLSMLQAAELASFEDHEDAYTDLIDTLERNPDQLDHRLAEWRQEYRLREQQHQLADELAHAGVTVVDAQLPADTRPLSRLCTSETDTTPLAHDPEAHASCPGHAAYITADPFHGTARAVYVCREWARHGHVDRWHATTPSSSNGPLTDEQKAERRRVIRNNKAWRAAEEVRRANLATLLTRKTPPPQAAQFLAQTLINGQDELRKAMENRHTLACDLLGLPAPGAGPHPLEEKLKRASAKQATMLSLAVVLAALEASTSVHTWRNPTHEQQRYFAALAEWGLPLHEVEQLVTSPESDTDAETDTESGDESGDDAEADEPSTA